MTLVVMAAGMGSRFGGLKQMQPIASDGKTILDFTVYDAVKSGFTKVVFIIRESMLADFKEAVGSRIEKKVKVEYVFQDESDLPVGRTKPFGTAHAIYCCKNVVSESFAIVNADDYYGRNAFTEIRKHLETAKNGEFAMVAYSLKNTLSKNGTVSRGVCNIKNGYLQSVQEIKAIETDGTYKDDVKTVILPEDTLISMNLWGLTPDVFVELEKKYKLFLEKADLSKDEIYVPSVISEMLAEGKASVKAFQTDDKWYGMTYRADLEEIKKAVGGYIKDGLYEGI